MVGISIWVPFQGPAGTKPQILNLLCRTVNTREARGEQS